MKSGKVRNKRVFILLTLVILVFALFAGNLFRLQVISGEDKDAAVDTQHVSVSAARGEILDRNGNALVYNVQSNSIVFIYDFFPSARSMAIRVRLIDSLIAMFDKAGAEWIDELPLEFDGNGKIMFSPDSDDSIAYLKSRDFLNLNSYATAQNCYDALIERYGLENYSDKQARDIASVCYNMKKSDFSTAVPYTFAQDVSEDLVAKIKENSSFYAGVDVEVVTNRMFTDGTLAPHILGLVGSLTAEEYAENKNNGYRMNDEIGKSGIELALESTLRGTTGEKTIVTDADGNKTSYYSAEPVAGNTVMLTIDTGLQKVAQNALAKRIDQLSGLREYNLAGSVVCMDVNSGEVLACATYPSYDATTYNENAQALNTDEDAPLWNRALQSTYTPGSTIKPCVAIGALEEGTIDGSFEVECKGRYTYFSDYQPKCTGHHGFLNVTNAIFNSCNIFFYETSRLMGITALNKYFSIFGLGSKTGIELNEADGIIDSVAYRQSIGETWTPGLTIQAGIGHASNLFTPIQLCNYCAMLATSGTRYQAHFVKKVLSYDRAKIVKDSRKEVLAEVNFSKDNWELVHKGMYKVANDGKADFSDVPVTVAAKTGTTTIQKIVNGESIETNNGLLICFGPYEKAEIAVSVVIEGAKSGSSTAPVAEAVMAYYFSDKYSGRQPAPGDENTTGDDTTDADQPGETDSEAVSNVG